VTPSVVWLPEAEADLRDAVAWYRNVSEDLAEQFVLAIDATVEALKESPLRFPVIYRNRQRAGVRRFPYGLFFEVQQNRIVVIACFHGRRNPQRRQSR
jgi:plasmid stabilization system protein ParE